MEHVQLSRDAELLNRVMNDPSVFPWISLGHKESVDCSMLLSDDRNYFFANEHGGFLVLDTGGGIYEIHTQFLPEGRGRPAILGAHEGMAFMFTQTSCVALKTFCPFNNRAATKLAKLAGMKRCNTETLWGVEGDTYVITRKEWLCLQSPQ